MRKVEQTILQIVESKKDVLFFIAITLLGVAIRLPGRWYDSTDMQKFFLPWYEEIKGNGGFVSLRGWVGDYGFPYQFLIAIMTYVPLTPVYSCKFFPCLFDFGLAFVGAKFACALKREKSAFLFLVIYGIILISPTVVLNSSVWGQCDSIYVFFLMLGGYCLWLERYRTAFVWIGVSFAFKLQAVFILPFLIFYYVKEKKFSIISGLGISVLAFYAMQLPGLLMGHSLLDPFRIYGAQTEEHLQMWMNYPSFWVLVGDDYEHLKLVAVLLTVCILGIGLYVFMNSAAGFANARVFIGVLIWSVWTCVLFLPAMHERYTYFVEILGIIYAVISIGTERGVGRYIAGGYVMAIFLCSVATYGNYLYGTEIDLKAWSIVNMIAYCCCLCHVIGNGKYETGTGFEGAWKN